MVSIHSALLQLLWGLLATWPLLTTSQWSCTVHCSGREIFRQGALMCTLGAPDCEGVAFLFWINFLFWIHLRCWKPPPINWQIKQMMQMIFLFISVKSENIHPKRLNSRCYCCRTVVMGCGGAVCPVVCRLGTNPLGWFWELCSWLEVFSSCLHPGWLYGSDLALENK